MIAEDHAELKLNLEDLRMKIIITLSTVLLSNILVFLINGNEV